MKKIYLLLFTLLLYKSDLHAQIITTIAGNGIAGYAGDGGPATTAEINGSGGIAIDGVGNLYVSDCANHRVRKVNTSGVISTIAGTGTAGYSGDGSLAISAQLNFPSGVAVDRLGNIYIADQYNERIRKINTLGIISTIAGNGTAGGSGDGGPAISGQMDHPDAVAVDTAGNVYISDQYNKTIRKVNTIGVISTYAGGGTSGIGEGGPATLAQLYHPSSVAVDIKGNVYFSDIDNTLVRKVNTAGIIFTIAGLGPVLGDGGPATAARMSDPDGIAIDSVGNVYIADFTSEKVRKIDTFGIINTVAGNGVSGFSGDGGSATAANLFYPDGVSVDRSGSIYIADDLNYRIRKVTPNSSLKNTNIRSLSETVEIFPNPVKETLTVCYNGSPKENGTISVYNIAQQQLQVKDFNTNSFTISVADYSPGLYFCKIMLDGQIMIRTITVK